MQTPIRELPEEARRQHQAELGLVIITRRPAPPPTENRKKMDERTQSPRGNQSRAAQALERMTEPPTFKEVAAHELKRAAVWMPLLISAGVGLLWVNKRFLLPIGK